jgi:hypothetical protein
MDYESLTLAQLAIMLEKIAEAKSMEAGTARKATTLRREVAHLKWPSIKKKTASLKIRVVLFVRAWA